MNKKKYQTFVLGEFSPNILSTVKLLQHYSSQLNQWTEFNFKSFWIKKKITIFFFFFLQQTFMFVIFFVNIKWWEIFDF